MKTTWLSFGSMLSVIMLLCACKSDTQHAASILPTDAAPPASPKPEVFLYWVTVDKLNLRDQPNKSGKVLTQFAEGEFVEGTGEISANKEEITLRDIPYIEPYFKVISTKPEQPAGWAFSAALSPVYAGSRSTLPDLGKLSQLSAFLKKLNVKKLESGKKAIDFVTGNFNTSSGTTADAAFIMLHQFLFRMELDGDYFSLTETMNWSEKDYEDIWKGRFDMNKYPVTKSLTTNGFALAEGEGMIFPVVDKSRLANFFAGKVTQPMKEYLLQQVEEQKVNAFEDGGIVVGLDTIVDRAIFWEKFNNSHPYFVLSQETRGSEDWLRVVVLSGLDNTPAHDYETNKPNESYAKMWAMVVQKYPGTKLAKAVKEITDAYAAGGGVKNPKVEEIITRYIGLEN